MFYCWILCILKLGIACIDKGYYAEMEEMQDKGGVNTYHELQAKPVTNIIIIMVQEVL